MQAEESRRSQVRNALRAATGGIHQRLHQAPAFAAIAEERLSIAGYTDLCRKIAVFHFTVAADLPLGPQRRELLARDLEALGAPAPAPLSWIAPASAPGKLGWLYVVEGSSLGSKIIYRQLDYLFGDSPVGRRFFRGSAADGDRWRSLCRRLERHAGTPPAKEEIIAGAAAAFAMFEQLLSPGVRS